LQPEAHKCFPAQAGIYMERRGRSIANRELSIANCSRDGSSRGFPTSTCPPQESDVGYRGDQGTSFIGGLFRDLKFSIL
jgi:hypothetical protein